ncbi:MAG: ribosome-associated translation inhibitor RaiA [Lutibacter sp.]|nr:ribosome-associated translation inhibitor RaiA [Lutibacter sp.]
MILNIQSNGLLIEQSVIKLLHQKINKLSRLYKEIIGSDINFRTEKASANEVKICEIRLIVPSYDLLASAQCKTFEEAIAETSEALERQIEKRKTKLKRETISLKKKHIS